MRRDGARSALARHTSSVIFSTLLLAVLCSCSKRAPSSSSKASSSPLTNSGDVASSQAPPLAPDQPREPSPNSAVDSIERELLHGRLVELVARPGDVVRGGFDAWLERPEAGAKVRLRLALALRSAPVEYKRSLAVYRLARARDARVVPVTVVRRVSVGELRAALDGRPELVEFVRAQAAIENDGRVAALLTAPGLGVGAPAWEAPSARETGIGQGWEVEQLDRWAASSEPVAGESRELVGGYVEMLVLDYLAGNLLRRSVRIDDEKKEIVLERNETAFPLHPDPRALDPLLARLRSVLRFPRGLRRALVRFDRERAEKAFLAGSFEDWLLPPRSILDLDERRIGLLSLIDARIAARGEAAVLCL